MLPERRLPVASDVPITLPGTSSIITPLPALPKPAVPM